MLINNPEALKSWLVVVLEPLCDADSSALARYVLALLKKDKSEKELKRVMIEQLDVFLGEETKPFVEKLFNAIGSEGYILAVENDDAGTITAGIVGESAVIAEANVTSMDAVNSNYGNIVETTLSSPYAEKIHTPPIDENKTKETQNSFSHKSNDAASTERSAQHHQSTVKTVESSSASSTTAYTSGGNQVRSVSPPPAKANADKENQPRESRRRRASLRSRSRSRSRSNERLSRRSRSRDRRINEREKNQRQFRNKSPPSLDSRHIGSHVDRRRGVGGDRRRIGNIGGGVDDRSPRFGGSGGEGERKRGGGRANRSNSRSRSPSLERSGGRGGKGSPSTSRRSPDRHSSHHSHAVQQHENEKRQRCRDFDEKGYCVRGETCPWDHGINPVVFEGINNSALMSMSLREYNPDAPDLWSRSATTTGGAIVSSATNTALLSAGSASGINPFTGAARPGGGVMLGVVGPGGAVGNFPHFDKNTNGAGTMTADYTRSANNTTGPGVRAAAPMIPFPFNPAAVTTPLQRELIPIPVVDASGSAAAGGDIGAAMQSGGKRRFELEDSVAIADGPTKRKLPLNSRLGPRMPSMQNNCSLELRKVPRGLNTIAHLNNHFAKFGKIVNIQISYDGDPEAAIVTFSTHAEANVAYRSTEAVLNNRFIKVFWHSQDAGTSSGGGEGGAVMPISGGGRKNNHHNHSQYHLNNVPAVPTPSADSAKTANTAVVNSQSTTAASTITPSGIETLPGAVVTPVAATHVAPPSLRLKNNVTPRSMQPAASNAIIRKKQEEQAKAVVQLANGLRKRKQELLQSYVKQVKSALELVERSEPNDPQRAKTLATINVLQEAIAKLGKEIAAEQEQMQAHMQNQNPPPPKKTKEQQKKELLDIELELFAQQQEGNDTTAIQKRLEELQRSLGIMPGSVGAIGNAGLNSPVSGGGKMPGGGRISNPRTRASYPEGSTRVDRRPKTIVVTGFTSEEADFVLGHFKHYGEITKHDVDKDIPQLILSYATRITAEQAVLRGKLFKDKRLQISWAPVVPQKPLVPIAQLGESNSTQSDIKSETDVTKVDTVPVPYKQSLSETDAIPTDTLPELRLEDEEEDEESEDRSWRR